MKGEKVKRRTPRHVGFIPDGNRRWARERGLPPGDGYAAGLLSGLQLLDHCLGLGIEEVSVYGFTQDNVKRPREQRDAFAAACVRFAELATSREIALRAVGDATSQVFPEALHPFAHERVGAGLKVNLLVNYGWEWDLAQASRTSGGSFADRIHSADVSRIDLVVRWGGMRRLSGFLPVQSVYADFFVVDELWPDYDPSQFEAALEWYARQDVTLGG